jgi:hypothetical protein
LQKLNNANFKYIHVCFYLFSRHKPGCILRIDFWILECEENNQSYESYNWQTIGMFFVYPDDIMVWCCLLLRVLCSCSRWFWCSGGRICSVVIYCHAPNSKQLVSSEACLRSVRWFIVGADLNMLNHLEVIRSTEPIWICIIRYFSSVINLNNCALAEKMLVST